MDSAPGATEDIALADVLQVLDGSGLRLASSHLNLRLPLTSPTLFDPRMPFTGRRSGILLGIGVHPSDPGSADIVRDAARRGFSAVVLKSLSASMETLGAVADVEGIALLVADDEIEWRQLDGLLGSALTSATEAHDSLSALVVGDLFALANAIAAMIGGATAIEDMQEHVLAYSTLQGQAIDEERREGILGRKVPDAPQNAEQYASVFRARGAVHLPGDPTGLPRLAVAIRAGVQSLGSVWVIDAAGEFAADEERALERAADIAGLHMLHARSSTDLARQQRVELLRRLIEGTGDSPLILGQLGLETSGPFVVVAFQPDFPATGDDLRMARLVDLIAMHSENHQHGAECVVIGGTVYSLFAGVAAADPVILESMARQLVLRAEAALRVPVRASIGSSITTAGQITRSRRDADLVLLLLAGRPGGGEVASARDAESQLTLLELAQVFRDTPRLVSEQARQVIDCDARTGTEYAKTLRTYLESARDSATTAARLSLHQNTLRYRLKRMNEKFGIDLDNADDTLTLWLSLRILEFG